jgi:hypothetical protein
MNLNQIKEITLDLIMDPTSGWEKHRSDFTSENQILTQFAVPLIALGALAGFVKLGIFKGAITGALVLSAVQLIVGIVALYIASFVVKFIAEKFDGHPTSLDAFRFVAFGNSVGWIGAILTIVPILGALASLGLTLYGIYVMFKGITPCIGVPQEKRMTFFIVTGAILMIISIILAAIIGLATVSVLGVGMLA